jgi:3-oxoacyl-[acyl-carrier protein] reductase
MTQRLILDPVDDPQISVEPRRSTYPDLAGKIAVVTGGSRGIGAATARALAANRATVALVGRDREALTAQTNAITTTGRRALAVVADCSVLEQLQHAAEEVARQLGPVEILAAFAGGRGEPVPTAQKASSIGGRCWRPT